MVRHRRNERAARAILASAETALIRAASALAQGQPLAAVRGARVVDQLMTLHAELEAKRDDDAARRAALLQQWRDLDDRAAELDDERRKVVDFCHAMGLNHGALTGLSMWRGSCDSQPNAFEDAPL